MTDERQRRIDLAAKVGFGTRAFTIGAQFATVPMALAALGTSDYGVWATITSTLGLLMFLDFGIGNGAMGRITEAVARHDAEAAASVIAHAYLILAVVAGTLILLIALGLGSGALQTAASQSSSYLAGHVMLVAGFVATYALIVPASFVQRVFFAYQQAGWAMVMQLTFAMAYLGFVAVAAWLGWGLAAFVMGYAGVMLAVYSLYTLFGLRHLLPARRTAWRFDRKLASALIRDGGLFFVLQATVAIVYNSDQMILSAYVGPDEVALYSTTYKLFGIVIMANGILLGPLWPAISDALARGDAAWVRQAWHRNRRRSMMMSLAASALLLAAGDLLLRIWTGGKLSAPWPLLFLMGLWVVLEGYGQCMAMLLNAMRIVRFQVAIALTLLVLGLALKVLLAGTFGIYGPLIATIVAFSLIVVVPETRYIERLWKRMP